MSFLFLSFFFFFFLLLRSKQTQRGSTKPSMTYYYRSSDCVESPRVLLSTHFSSNSRSSQLIRLFWTMRCGMQRTIVFFSFLSPYSLSLSLSHIYTHTYTFALSNSPSFVSSIQNETARRCNRTSEHVRRKRTIYRAHAREKTGSFTETFPKISRGKYTQSNRNFKRKNQGFGG